MPRVSCLLIFLVTISLFISCGRRFKSEKEESAYWNSYAIDSAYSKLYRYKDTAIALRYLDQLLQNSSISSPYTRAARFGILANYYYFFTKDTQATAGMVDSALCVFNNRTLRNRYPRAYVGLLLFAGHLSYQLKQYSKANAYYFKAKKLGEAHLDECEQKAFNYSIAMVLYRQRNFSQSLNYFRRAFLLQNTCNPQTTAVALQQQEIQSNMGLCLFQLENYDSALIHFDRALDIANQYRDSLGPATMDKIYGVVYGNKARVYMAQNRMDLAEQLSLKSIALNARPGYEMENAREVKLHLAELYSRKGNYSAMLQLLQNLRRELDSSANPQIELGWRKLMSVYYEKTGRYQLGLSAYKSFTSLEDSIENQQKDLSEADVNRQLDVMENENQIALLKKDNQIGFILLWVIVGASLMGLAFFILLGIHFMRNRKNLALSLALNEEIRRQKSAREEEAKQWHKEMTEAVIQAQETERALIGLELHDNINQVLTTVKLHNEMAMDGTGDPKLLLSRASLYLQECINEIRSLSKRLSAPSLGEITLEESVNELLDSVNFNGKVKINRNIDGMKNKIFAKELHLGIYRILQEQLNNVLKHSDASEICVMLENHDDSIRLLISDNGKGFAVNCKKAGIGLRNMRTRSEHLNGTFILNSAPGAGCSVEVIVPYSAPSIKNFKTRIVSRL